MRALIFAFSLLSLAPLAGQELGCDWNEPAQIVDIQVDPETLESDFIIGESFLGQSFSEEGEPYRFEPFFSCDFMQASGRAFLWFNNPDGLFIEFWDDSTCSWIENSMNFIYSVRWDFRVVLAEALPAGTIVDWQIRAIWENPDGEERRTDDRMIQLRVNYAALVLPFDRWAIDNDLPAGQAGPLDDPGGDGNRKPCRIRRTTQPAQK